MNPKHKLFHPKWHRPRTPIFWWLRKLSYTRFITRELTSIPVAYTAVLLLAQVWVLSRGEEAYERFLAVLRSPAAIVFHALILVGLLFHTVTWLNLAPKALVVRLGGRRVPDAAITLAHYAAWLVASALIWVVLGR